MSETARRVAIALAGIISALGLAVAFSIATAQPRPAPSGDPGPPSNRPSVAPADVAVRAFRDFSILPGEPAEPPGVALQSRLWTVDGRWWGALVDPTTRETRIFALSADGASWTDTGTLLDERPGAMVDAAWSGDRLYVASAVPGRSRHDALRVGAYVHDAAGGFVLAPNFPVVLTDAGVEASSVARDSTGRVWVAWVADGRVTVASSGANEALWGAPRPLADPAAAVGEGDVAALVPFGEDRLGLVWTTRTSDVVHFASRGDAEPPDRWSPVEIAFDGEPLAEAAISAATGPDGAVVVAVETAVADEPDAGEGDPGSALLVRGADGTWRSALFARVDDRLGGPVAVVDPANGQVHVFAVSPRHGGAVHLKSAEPNRLEFPAGRGTVLISDPSQPDIAFLTSAKRTPSLDDGIVVLGFDEAAGTYWHAIVTAADGAGRTPSPSANGSVAPSGGPSGPIGTLLVNDDFDPWPIDAAIEGGWELTPETTSGILTAAADPAGGAVALLRPAGAESVRACRDFPTTASGELVVEARVSVDAIGPADAVITSLRDRGDEAVAVRFGQGGTFVYYAGETRVRTTAGFSAGTWYRSTATVDLAGRTYDWRLTTDDGAVVVDVRAVPFREATAIQVSQVCVGSSAGVPGAATRFDDVRVIR